MKFIISSPTPSASNIVSPVSIITLRTVKEAHDFVYFSFLYGSRKAEMASDSTNVSYKHFSFDKQHIHIYKLRHAGLKQMLKAKPNTA